jgi:coatomer subunit beta'
MERAWTFAAIRGSHLLAVGHDEGAVVLKFGCDEPAVSMDSNGKVVWARHNEVLTGSVKASPGGGREDSAGAASGSADSPALSGAGHESARDGEVTVLATKELGRTEIYPKFLRHDPTGRFVVVCGDGEHVIYTALAWRNKSYGPAVDFVWGDASAAYAIREGSGRVKIFKNFKENSALKPPFTPEGLFGGALLGVASSRSVLFYDWDARLVRRVEAVPKNVYWSDAGDLCVLATDSSFFVLRYNAGLVATALASGAVGEDGVEAALEVVHEVADRVRNGQWVGDCFVYVSGGYKLSYCVGGHVFNLAHIDRHLHLLGYLPRDGAVYLADRRSAGTVVSYHLNAAVVGYQTAVLRGDLERAISLLPQVPAQDRLKIAQFLHARGALEEAFAVSPDPDHRFELACELGRLEDALKTAKEAPHEHKWRALGDLAQKAGRFDLAEECLRAGDDAAGLFLLYTTLGSHEKLAALAALARDKGLNNIAFACLLATRRLDQCISLLAETGRVPEAAFMARTYAPSRVPALVKVWRAELAKVNAKAAEALADPLDFPNLFPDLKLALVAEEMLRKEYEIVVPASQYEEAKQTLARDPIAELKEAEAAKAEAEAEPEVEPEAEPEAAPAPEPAPAPAPAPAPVPVPVPVEAPAPK